jgi:hypothetical protein
MKAYFKVKISRQGEGEMSYQERRSIVNLISTILISALYSAYMIQRYPEGNTYSADVFRFWGAFFLILIPVYDCGKNRHCHRIRHPQRYRNPRGEPPITDEARQVN